MHKADQLWCQASEASAEADRQTSSLIGTSTNEDSNNSAVNCTTSEVFFDVRKHKRIYENSDEVVVKKESEGLPLRAGSPQRTENSEPYSNGEVKLSIAKLPKPENVEACPRCGSMDTKFCYYNNYNVKQPRYFCKACQRYWTAGGTLRNIAPGSGRRKHKGCSGSKDSDRAGNGLFSRHSSPPPTSHSSSMAAAAAVQSVAAAAAAASPFSHSLASYLSNPLLADPSAAVLSSYGLLNSQHPLLSHTMNQIRLNQGLASQLINSSLNSQYSAGSAADALSMSAVAGSKRQQLLSDLSQMNPVLAGQNAYGQGHVSPTGFGGGQGHSLSSEASRLLQSGLGSSLLGCAGPNNGMSTSSKQLMQPLAGEDGSMDGRRTRFRNGGFSGSLYGNVPSLSSANYLASGALNDVANSLSPDFLSGLPKMSASESASGTGGQKGGLGGASMASGLGGSAGDAFWPAALLHSNSSLASPNALLGGGGAAGMSMGLLGGGGNGNGGSNNGCNNNGNGNGGGDNNGGNHGHHHNHNNNSNASNHNHLVFSSGTGGLGPGGAGWSTQHHHPHHQHSLTASQYNNLLAAAGGSPAASAASSLNININSAASAGLNGPNGNGGLYGVNGGLAGHNNGNGGNMGGMMGGNGMGFVGGGGFCASNSGGAGGLLGGGHNFGHMIGGGGYPLSAFLDGGGGGGGGGGLLQQAAGGGSSSTAANNAADLSFSNKLQHVTAAQMAVAAAQASAAGMGIGGSTRQGALSNAGLSALTGDGGSGGYCHFGPWGVAGSAPNLANYMAAVYNAN